MFTLHWVGCGCQGGEIIVPSEIIFQSNVTTLFQLGNYFFLGRFRLPWWVFIWNFKAQSFCLTYIDIGKNNEWQVQDTSIKTKNYIFIPKKASYKCHSTLAFYNTLRTSLCSTTSCLWNVFKRNKLFRTWVSRFFKVFVSIPDFCKISETHLTGNWSEETRFW